jgi:hypothetical protein
MSDAEIESGLNSNFGVPRTSEDAHSDWHRPLQWYEHEYADALLTDEDNPWLKALSGKRINEDWLNEANRVIAAGSINLRSNPDPETLTSVMQARRMFFGQLLGWDDDKHPLHHSYQVLQEHFVRLARPKTVIHSQRILLAYGLNAAKIIKSSPHALVYEAATIKDKCINLEQNGLDVRRVVNYCPSVLGYSQQTINEKIANLQYLGLEVPKIVNASPVVLRFGNNTIKQKLEALQNLGFQDPGRAISRYPSLLALPSDNLWQKKNNLSELGLDAAKIINLSPTVLGMASETIASKMRRLERYAKILNWPGGVIQLINTYPAILGLSSKKLYAHARLFSRYGRPDMTPQHVSQMIIAPLDTHLIAIGEGHITKPEDYRQPRLEKITKSSSAEERAERLAGVLSSTELAVRIGSKAMVAYQKYKAPKK